MADAAKITCPNCRRLEQRIAQQDQEIATLQARQTHVLKRIEQLEALQRQNSQNSSKPPSSDPPSAPAPPAKKKSKRKRGGQPGHPKHQRPLIPTDECDDVQTLKPTQCRRCGEKLAGRDPQPLRHQVWELPVF